MSEEDDLIKGVSDVLNSLSDAEKKQRQQSLKRLIDAEMKRRKLKPLKKPKKD